MLLVVLGCAAAGRYEGAGCSTLSVSLDTGPDTGAAGVGSVTVGRRGRGDNWVDKWVDEWVDKWVDEWV